MKPSLKVIVRGTKVTAELTDVLTSGMVGVPVEFQFDEDWGDLRRLGVFEGSGQKKYLDLNLGDELTIPWEVLTEERTMVKVGVEGRNADGTVVIPTLWAEVGVVLPGAQAGNDPALKPTPSEYDQIMKAIDDGRLRGEQGPQGEQGPAGPQGEPGKDSVDLGITGASVGQIAQVTAVDKNGVPTKWSPVDMPSGGGSGGETWTKLGDVSVSQTYEFIPLSFENGVVTIDPNAENYEWLASRASTLCVVHPIDATTKEIPSVGILKVTDAAAGTFSYYNRDNVSQPNTSKDPTVYKISVWNVASVVMPSVGEFKNYKLRITTPVLSTNGLRPFFASPGMSALGLPAMISASRSGGGFVEIDVYECPYDDAYYYKRIQMAWGVDYNANSTSEVQAFVMGKSGVGINKPNSNGEVTFNPANMLFVNGTRFELWGCN